MAKCTSITNIISIDKIDCIMIKKDFNGEKSEKRHCTVKRKDRRRRRYSPPIGLNLCSATELDTKLGDLPVNIIANTGWISRRRDAGWGSVGGGRSLTGFARVAGEAVAALAAVLVRATDARRAVEARHAETAAERCTAK